MSLFILAFYLISSWVLNDISHGLSIHLIAFCLAENPTPQGSVDLKHIEKARYISSKISLFRNKKELQFRTCSLMAIHMQVQRNKGKNTLLWTWEELL